MLREAAESGPLRGLLAYTELPHASCDFNHDPHSAIVDGSQTRVSGPRLVNLLADKGKFGAFAYYCWAAGAISLAASLAGL